MDFKSGFVSIIGRPNVGKSTLINRMIGQKVSIVSDKPQTTRNKIQSIYTDEEAQIVFLDTPGIHKPKNQLGEFMVSSAKSSIRDVDLIVFMVDHSKDIGKGDEFILDELNKISTKKILLINKIDKLEQDDVNNIYDNFADKNIFDKIIPISATEGINVENLINILKTYMPNGPKYFPDDMITDQPERVLTAEIVREKILHYTEQEIPHGIAVEIVGMKPRSNKSIIDIDVNIYCERKSHKGIIIGKAGRKLKGIGKSAREELERILGSKVNLQLWVKVKENWRNQNIELRNFGYRNE